MKVYISLISHFDGMLQDQETVRCFNLFMIQEVKARGYDTTYDPMESDVILLLPTYQYDKYCMEEYEQFKNSKVILTSLEQLEGFMMEACA